MQINKAINNTIESALVDTDFKDVEIVAKDFTDGIQRPSLKVGFDNSKTGKFNKQLKERTLTVRVYFFAKDKNYYKIDNLKMQDIIENAFLEDIQITPSFFMPIVNEEGVQSEIIDTVLECSFDIYSLEEIYDDSALEPIETLNLKLELKIEE